MALTSRRSKMVSIRLSHDEFRRLRELCAASGARSLSDLARDAMHRFMISGSQGNGGVDQDLTARVSELDQRLSYLQEKVARLASLVETRG